MRRLPKTVYVAWRDQDATAYLLADTAQGRLVEDDGPTIVGTYQLIEQHELSKVVQAKPKRG